MKLKTSVKYQIFNHFMLVITASLGACSAIAVYYVCIAMNYANEPVNAIMVIDGYDFIFVAIMIISAFYYYVFSFQTAELDYLYQSLLSE